MTIEHVEYSLLGGRPRKFIVAAYESYETGYSIVINLSSAL